MKTLRYTVAGEECTVYVPEYEDDLVSFYEFLGREDKFLAVDTESTGFDLFTRDHKLRLVQFGNSTEAWVIRTDKFAHACIKALRQPRNFLMHNAPFDCLTIDRHLGVGIEELMPKVWDTKIIAHLRDPRGKEEGGIGLKLKQLCESYIDPNAPDTQEDLTRVFNSFGWTKSSGWARISIDHMTYLLYAGLDVILTHRLFIHLYDTVQSYRDLCKMEHRLQYLLTLMCRRGLLLDMVYINSYLVTDLHNEWIEQCDIAADFGVHNVQSNQEVIAALLGMGEELTERTPKDNLKMDRAVLEPLADLDRKMERIGAREPNPLAAAVYRAKRAKKWLTAYAEACVKRCDAENRIHPVLNSLQARTARMSVSAPPLQQLPSGDWRIRRSFIPDPGYAMISVDYKAVEMRVLAGLSGDHTMRSAIAAGADLHDFTAEKVFGPGFSSRERKIAKNIGFGKVYGGGAKGVARLTGADEESVRAAMVAYDNTFPGIKRYSQKLIKVAQQGILEVTTPIGRRLPLDEDRLYAATNYMVQSTARDLLAQAIIRLCEKGFGDYLLLPVHDELLGQAPVEQAQEIVTEIGEVMKDDFMGVAIDTSAEVYGPSWGAGYKAPAFLPEPPVRKERKARPGSWDQDLLF